MKNVFEKNLDINEKNIYTNSKDPAFNQKILEEEVVDDVLKVHLDAFHENVVFFKESRNSILSSR